MFTRKMRLTTAAVAVLTIGLIGCSDDDENPMNSGSSSPTKDIVETAAAAGNFTTLLAAAEAADLVDALKGAGPITVFAPTDEAFAKLPAGTVEALLNDPAALSNILLYHVTPGVVKAADVVTLTEATMANGGTVSIAVENGGVKINDANVLFVDIAARNGVLHIIDGVLIP